MTINAQFVKDKVRDEVTWISRIGVAVKGRKQHSHKGALGGTSTLRFEALSKLVYVNERNKFKARDIEKITLTRNKLTVINRPRHSPAMPFNKSSISVTVDLPDIPLSFSVDFIGDHLDIIYYRIPITVPSVNIGKITPDRNETLIAARDHIYTDRTPLTMKRSLSGCSFHGLIGQFFCPGISIDEIRRLLLFPLTSGREPVPVMRRPVWSFMERESAEPKELCWMAMNAGYQGEGLIEGQYLDYVVPSLLSTKYVSPNERKKAT